MHPLKKLSDLSDTIGQRLQAQEHIAVIARRDRLYAAKHCGYERSALRFDGGGYHVEPFFGSGASKGKHRFEVLRVGRVTTCRI